MNVDVRSDAQNTFIQSWKVETHHCMNLADNLEKEISKTSMTLLAALHLVWFKKQQGTIYYQQHTVDKNKYESSKQTYIYLIKIFRLHHYIGIRYGYRIALWLSRDLHTYNTKI